MLYLKNFLFLSLWFLSFDTTFVSVVDAKPANGLVGGEPSVKTKFTFFREILNFTDFNDSTQEEDGSKESGEKEEEEDYMVVGFVSESPATRKDDDDKKDVQDDMMKISKPRLVKRAASGDKNPPNEGEDNIAAIDEAMKGTQNSTMEVPKNKTTTMKPGTKPVPTKAPGKKKKQRRNSEVAKWPPSFPYSQSFVDTYAESTDDMNSDKGINAEGGIISTGKVAETEEEDDTTDRQGMNRGSTEGGEHATVTNTPESDDMAPSSNSSDNKLDNPKGKSSGLRTTMKPKGHKDGSGSSGNQVVKKPGKCRPLTAGLACIALSPDASQCSTDDSCPSTKKCCFYGCAPYRGIGICEFPVMY